MTLFVLLVLSLVQGGFSQFSFCRENSRGPFESQCIELDPEGKGEVRFKRREAEMVNLDIELSPGGRARFLAVVAATDNLANGSSYESNRKVADLGLKRVAIELPGGRREASFNYSTRREVIELVSFFENLISQETLGFDMDMALQFERLSIPKRLEQIEGELRARRVADPHRLIPMLQKIENEPRLVNFARTRAARLREQIEASQQE
jgi:hypothetical protein